MYKLREILAQKYISGMQNKLDCKQNKLGLYSLRKI